MLYLINPTGSARTGKRRKRSTTKRRVRHMARKKRGKRRRRNPGLTPAAFANPRRKRRRNVYANKRGRRRRRNPGMFGGGQRGIVGQLTQGAMDALGVVTGKAASRAIPALVGLNQTGPTGVAIQAAAAIAAGWLGNMVNRNFGRMALAGGLSGIVEGFIKVANIPVISAALGDEYDAVMGAYVTGGDEERLGLYAGGGDSGDYADDASGDAVGLLTG